MVLDHSKDYFQVGYLRMSKSIKLDKIHQKRPTFNSAILVLLAFLYVLWGTGWSIPIVNISLPGIWYLVILFLLISQFKYTNIFNHQAGLITLITILILLLVYSLIGLPQVASSNDYMRDLKYLLEYDLKFIVSLGIIFVFWKFCSSFDDLELMFKWISLTYFFLTAFLYWKYFYVHEVGWLGVGIGDYPNKGGKNSFAIAAALILPYLIAFLISARSYWNKFFGFLGVVAIATIALTIISRSMIIVIIFSLLSLVFFLNNRKVKTIIFAFISIILIAALVLNFSFTNFMLKQNNFDDSNFTNSSSEVIPTVELELKVNDYVAYSETQEGFIQKYLNSHRGWLVREGFSGFKNSYLMGNGVSTFRIRTSNNGNRTETHNDYIMIMYEQGILGFLGLLFLLIYRIKRTIKANAIFLGNTYVTASLSSLICLSVALLFINIYATPIFWIVIALNWLIIDKLYANSIDNIISKGENNV